MSVHILVRFSYPKQPGDTPWSIADINGPTSYVQIVEESPGPPVVPPSGGQPLFPRDFALESFHILLAQGSADGGYAVQVIPLLVVDTSNPGGDAFVQALLMWIDLGTGQQVAAGEDLSQFSVRLLAIGN